jgi:hypothetical protein
VRKFIIFAATLVTALASAGAASARSGVYRHHALEARTSRDSSVCVGHGPGCFAQIQPAVDAARNGATIRVGAGTFAGGVTIDKSIRLIGAGPDLTVINGGGPVVTIGVAGAASEPTVTIDGVTVTGGNTVSNLSPVDGRGGGVYIPRAAGPSTGATVTIRNSVIRDNRVAPGDSTDSGLPCPCPYASAGGGGISNDGTLTLEQTVVTRNRADGASGLTSDADGGGILNRAFGDATLTNSVVSDNHATVTAPNGRFADGGGILMVAGSLQVRHSVVSDNSATVATEFGAGVETAAGSGGIHIEGSATAVIEDSTISANVAAASNPNGDPVAFCGGLCSDGSLSLRGGSVTDNRVTASVAGNSSSSGNPSADSGGIGIGCCQEEPTSVTLSGTRISDNEVSATAAAGDAFAAAAAVSMANTPAPVISDSAISGNHEIATSVSGSVTLRGAIENGGELVIRDTAVDHNTGTASAPAGVAQGGGIWNGEFDSASPAPKLSLTRSSLARNRLVARGGVIAHGGGLFTTAPVSLAGTTISGNAPDDCYGC